MGFLGNQLPFVSIIFHPYQWWTCGFSWWWMAGKYSRMIFSPGVKRCYPIPTVSVWLAIGWLRLNNTSVNLGMKHYNRYFSYKLVGCSMKKLRGFHPRSLFLLILLDFWHSWSLLNRPNTFFLRWFKMFRIWVPQKKIPFYLITTHSKISKHSFSVG